MLLLENISKIYRRKAEKIHALDGVSVDFNKGFQALIGPNGGGKSTLMGVATTLVKPTSGSVYFNGEPLKGAAKEDYRRKVGYVPQHISFVRSMSCLETLKYVGWAAGMSRPVVAQRAKDLLEEFGLAGKTHERTRALSGGQLRRLGLAAAMLHQPEVVFLDEPTVGLDPEARVQVRQLVGDIAQRATVIMSTHLVEDIRYMPGALHILARGKLAYSGTWEDLAARVPDVTDGMGSSFEMAYGQIIREIQGATMGAE